MTVCKFQPPFMVAYSFYTLYGRNECKVLERSVCKSLTQSGGSEHIDKNKNKNMPEVILIRNPGNLFTNEN